MDLTSVNNKYSWEESRDISAEAYQELSFDIYADKKDLSALSVQLENDLGEFFPVATLSLIPAGSWMQVILTMDQLNPNGSVIHRINIREDNNGKHDYFIDNLKLAGSDTLEVGAWDAKTAAFTYDANGNLKSQSGKIDDIAYDHRNLPVKFSMAGGQEVLAAYNAEGQRIIKESSGGAYQFYVMDGPQTLAVIDQNGLSHVNLVGNSTFGRLEASSGSIDTTNARRYYVTDHLGSTRAVVDETGEVLDTFDYYPFGLIMPKRETDATGTMERFTGKERDDEGNLNLDYFGARYYDPALGRWHSVDPLADDLAQVDKSPYAYTWNNPVNLTDPDGKCVPWCVGAAVGAVVEFGSQVAVNYANGDSFAEAVDNVDYTDVALSAGAGALTGGLSTLRNVGTVAKAGVAIATSVGEGASKANLGSQTSSFGADEAITDGVLGAVSFGAGEFAEAFAKGTKEGRRLGGIARRAESRAQRAPSNMNIKNAQKTRKAATSFAAKRGELAGGGIRAAGTGVVVGTGDSGKQGSPGMFLIITGGNSSAPADNTQVVIPIRRDEEQR